MNFELVPSSIQYLEFLYSCRKQPSTVQHNPLVDCSIEQLAYSIEKEGHDLSNINTHEVYRWIGLLNGEPIGNVNLKKVNHSMLFAEIGYGVAEAFQGKGFGTLMVKSFVVKVFKETNLRKIIAFVHDKNVYSCRLLESIGFVPEGLLREHYIINNRPENEVYYGMLRSDLNSV